MAIKTISVSRLELELRATLNECAVTGLTVVVELSDQRFVIIQPLEPTEDDDLTSDLLESNPAFRDSVTASRASGRKPFLGDTES